MIAKCQCQACQNPIEFDVEDSGSSVECPHCGQSTRLVMPSSNVQEKPKRVGSRIPLVAGIVLVLVIALLAIFQFHGTKPSVEHAEIPIQPPKTNSPIVPPPRKLTEEENVNALRAKPILMSLEEKEARDHILKALLDISSATSLGVNRNKYADLLTSALSTVTFEKTKLTTDRHEKYLICAAKAIGYYAKANEQWESYFKYTWMQNSKEALMSQSDFDDLRENGVKLTSLSYRSHEDKQFFYVSFNDCLSLYWQAADIYIDKMKSDVQK